MVEREMVRRVELALAGFMMLYKTKVGKKKLSWQAKSLVCQSFYNLQPTTVSIAVIERTG